MNSSNHEAGHKTLGPGVELVYVFGGNGPLDPGWYLRDPLRGPLGQPIAGPFNSGPDAEQHFIVTVQRNRDPLHPHREQPFGGLGERTLVLQPNVMLRPEQITIATGARIDSFVKIEGGEGVSIGRDVHIASFCHLGIGGGTLIMEDGSSAGSGARILTGSALPTGESCSAAAPREQQVLKKQITRIGRNATIYAGATVLPGVHVGEGAFVGAGAVVTKDVPAYEVWAGVPARHIADRVDVTTQGDPAKRYLVRPVHQDGATDPIDMRGRCGHLLIDDDGYAAICLKASGSDHQHKPNSARTRVVARMAVEVKAYARTREESNS